MSRKAKPTLVGAFVIGAILLAIGGMLAVADYSRLLPHHVAVIYFDGSVNGLNVGAPVTWRGARIGRVTKIKVNIDAVDRVFTIPVYIELEPRKATFVRGTDNDVTIPALVKLGLRAQLRTQSLVTGQLYVELEMMPGTAARFVGKDDSPVPEIPAVQSGLENFEAGLEHLPLRQLGDAASQLLVNLNAVVSAPEVRSLLAKLVQNSDELNGLLRDVHSQVVPLSDSITSTADATKATLVDIRKLANNADGQLTLASSDLRSALKSADQSFRTAQATLAAVDSMVAPNGTERNDIDSILRDLAYTSQSLRRFSAEVERNPNTLLVGGR